MPSTAGFEADFAIQREPFEVAVYRFLEAFDFDLFEDHALAAQD